MCDGLAWCHLAAIEFGGLSSVRVSIVQSGIPATRMAIQVVTEHPEAPEQQWNKRRPNAQVHFYATEKAIDCRLHWLIACTANGWRLDVQV